jgi:ABC-type multidrug transport system fused ATPase/permease subunit
VRGKCKESISIKFDKIGFAYPARPASVLGPNFILDINAGENIALVGGSGSGKSTISLLLTRLYNLDNGRILLNGKDVLDIDPAIVREQIGVVSQEPLLFSGTIYDSIRYGRPGASHEEVSKQTCSCFIRHTHLRLMLAFRHYGALLQILEAARSAHVTHFTDALPEGLQTQVGSRGTQLR